MYVAAKGGERAIDAAHDWLARERRGDPSVPEIGVAQIREQLALAVDRVMAEGALHDPDLAALAIKQARGDLVEAAFLIRAFRASLPRWGASKPVDTGAMACDRRISAAFKDLPGGQVLGPTFDYTHRLLDPALADTPGASAPARANEPGADAPTGGPGGGAAPGEGGGEEAGERAPRARPKLSGALGREGVLRDEPQGDPRGDSADLTREPLSIPAPRDARLQALARGDEGFLLGLAYSTQRGYGRNHAFVGELRTGACVVEWDAPGIGRVAVGEITLTEVETINQFAAPEGRAPAFTSGYGLAFGRSERRALAMALLDRAMASEALGEAQDAPAQDQEFVLLHADGIQAAGFLEHIKLPHHVDFQAELELVRRLRREAEAQGAWGPGAGAREVAE